MTSTHDAAADIAVAFTPAQARLFRATARHLRLGTTATVEADTAALASTLAVTQVRTAIEDETR
jgi:hypothetical protein